MFKYIEMRKGYNTISKFIPSVKNRKFITSIKTFEKEINCLLFKNLPNLNNIMEDDWQIVMWDNKVEKSLSHKNLEELCFMLFHVVRLFGKHLMSKKCRSHVFQGCLYSETTLLSYIRIGTTLVFVCHTKSY